MDARPEDIVRVGFIFTSILVLITGFLWVCFGPHRKRKEDGSCYGPRFSTEGKKAGDELKAEFSKLVIAISYHNLAEKNKTCPGSHFVGVEEDMKNAFLQAIEEVYLVNKDNSHSGIGAVLDRIEQLRGKYETQ